MAQDLEASCDRILDTLTDMESTVALELESPLSLIKNKVNADSQTFVMALTHFLKKVEQEKPLMRNAVKECVRILRLRMKIWISDLTTNTENSIVSECMEEIYSAARVLKLKPPQRQAKFEDGIVGDASLWMAVHACASERLEEMLDKRQHRFKKHVFSILTDIVVAFRSCCKDKETEDATEIALRVQLRGNLIKAKDIYEGVLAKAIRECKQC
jgi:hypothetical protein